MLVAAVEVTRADEVRTVGLLSTNLQTVLWRNFQALHQFLMVLQKHPSLTDTKMSPTSLLLQISVAHSF